jgi:hypothetical protein
MLNFILGIVVGFLLAFATYQIVRATIQRFKK